MSESIEPWMKEKAADQAARLTESLIRDDGALTAEAVASNFSTIYASIVAALVADPGATADTVEDIVKPTPAEIRKSIKPDGIVSFIDGKPYKTLKRHLTGMGLSPGEYRTRYGLPQDYPMVCANYSAARSALAKQTGLGQRGAAAD